VSTGNPGRSRPGAVNKAVEQTLRRKGFRQSRLLTVSTAPGPRSYSEGYSVDRRDGQIRVRFRFSSFSAGMSQDALLPPLREIESALQDEGFRTELHVRQSPRLIVLDDEGADA
jgi:hypothetical protein